MSNELDNLSTRAFGAHVATLKRRHGVPAEEKINKEAFESLEDLEAFMVNHSRAETRSGKPTATTSRQTRTTSSSSAAGQRAIAAALAKKKADREARDSQPTARHPQPTARHPQPTARHPQPRQVPKSKPPRPRQGTRNTAPASQPISDLMIPGLYNGDPWRQVGTEHLPREIDPSVAKFRRQRRGSGKCTGNKLKAVVSAYSDAYYFTESARQEVASIRRSSDAMLLWHASRKYEAASLAYWFGADYSPRQINRMLTKIESILTQWSLAFCAGFRGHLPVWIRCKSKNGVGGGPARHLVANTIELFPRYFDMSQNKRRVTMLHEMGHHSTGPLTPRDERHPLCEGGWNRAENMCYRDTDDVDTTTDGIFLGGSPRTLAVAATGGDVSARKAALNNIDNYVCYMWNRDKDHKATTLYMLPPRTKAPRPAPRATTAPSRG